ncbi:unnamed protein product [Chondrus crispus]|uniref:Uncharacterized protein n=1 Tax=Chondrus crispus TaxID=2769 RepID=R7QA19_CHOCR|nr:unnamed protein product [Chondrus crispus]CDF34613.1 unnamed protein product [Chondrus crispus]|eukprot:XP_005714432.1 unnamed protein product [Chondrus crispus]
MLRGLVRIDGGVHAVGLLTTRDADTQGVEEAEDAAAEEVDQNDAQVIREGQEEGGAVAAARIQHALDAYRLYQAGEDENDCREKHARSASSEGHGVRVVGRLHDGRERGRGGLMRTGF